MSPVGRDDLGFKIKTISKLLAQNMTNSIASLDLTSSQSVVLGYLCYRAQRQETVYPRDLERHFSFTHPTVSGLLQRLVSDMSPVEITQLHSFLDRMIQNLSASNGAAQAVDPFPRSADKTERKPEDHGWQSPDIR